MRLSKYFLPTLREVPAEAEVVSHKLMLRAGMIKKLASGVYDYLPVGLKTIRKVEAIVRKCLDEAGAIELLMPAVQPAELWEESGRWGFYGKELLRLKDRHDRDFCIGPTHEEVITDIVRHYMKSYKQLPVNLYQIQAKFRDEVRPRFGLMRGREFVMKDAYSFDMDEKGAETSYEIMRKAYCRIFEECGLEYTVVSADSGAIGGSFSHEFMVLADTGEDFIISCEKCGYGANVEKAELRDEYAQEEGDLLESKDVETPNAKTVEEVATFLHQPAKIVVKTMLVDVDGEVKAFMVRGDHELNLAKVKNHFGAATAELATPQQIVEATNGPLGFSGPVGINVPVYADYAVKYLVNYTVGANKKETHTININHGRDFEVAEFSDFRNAEVGDKCCECDGEYRITKGIEVGHIFKLGTKYSEAMKAEFLDNNGKRKPFVMGCYGIGITRVVAAAIEQNHDEKGIKWPVQLAPFEVCVIPLNTNDEEVMNTADTVYLQLKKLGVDVVIDDRNERAGAKFTDAELVGYPLRVNIGKKGLAEGMIEVTDRMNDSTEKVAKGDSISYILEKLKELKGN